MTDAFVREEDGTVVIVGPLGREMTLLTVAVNMFRDPDDEDDDSLEKVTRHNLFGDDVLN